MEPWGTPAFIYLESEVSPFITTCWRLLDRKLSSNHLRTVSSIPMFFLICIKDPCVKRGQKLTYVTEYYSCFFSIINCFSEVIWNTNKLIYSRVTRSKSWLKFCYEDIFQQEVMNIFKNTPFHNFTNRWQ